MKISYNWLKEYIDIDLDPDVMGTLLTNTGLEVEGIETYEEIEGSLGGLVVGEVITCEKHPNADRLSLTAVDIGEERILPIICGAPNVAKGQKVVVAPVGTTLHPFSGDPFEIKRTKIRGEVSEGMICAEDEIGLGDDHSGVLVLETELPNGMPVSSHFQPYRDHIFEIGLTPNRSDATSHIGVARDIRAITSKEVKWPPVDDFRIDNQDLPIEVVVENKTACPRYSGITLSGITIRESPRWLKNKLHSIGLTPINNVVDITNFILHEMGQPLHAFDADQITGKKVVVRTMKEGTRFVTLDEVERELKDHDLMICNAREGMCIAGVFGGIKSGVTEKTKNIFLESAYFSPDYIRRTSQFHELKTDASFRFERGTDPESTVYALKRAATLIREIAGGTISSDIIDIYPEPVPPFKVTLNYKHVDRLVGNFIPRNRIKNILQSLDIKVQREDDQGLSVIVPPYRADVQREADVIEELLRIYGYDNIRLTDRISSDYLAESPDKDPVEMEGKLTDLLASGGFFEIKTNSLTSPRYAENIESFDPTDNIEILNKLSEELGVLRQSILFTGLEVVAYNINHRQKDLKFFELGKIYHLEKGKYLESNQLFLLMTGNYESENWIRPTRQVEFHDLYEVIQKILHKFNITGYQIDFGRNKIFRECVSLFVKDKILVTFGWLSRKVLGQYDIKENVLSGIFDWEYFTRLASKEITIEEVSKYPEVRRDLSLVIDKSVTFNDILKIVSKKENQLVRRINVFDYYEGDKIEKSRKAYAMSFILQDRNQTLTDRIIDKTMNHLMKSFENELGAVIRK
jgi:phenylalanyl-tRNA synthetase beta chain